MNPRQGWCAWLRLLAAVVTAAVSVACLSQLALAATAPPRVTARETVVTNYYTVTGATARALAQSKAQARPWKDKMPFDACTESDITWTYRYRQGGERVALESLETVLKVAVNLPRWTPPPEASPELTARWDRFVKSLGTHEVGHVTLARSAAAELRTQLAAVGTFSSASELAAALERIGQRVMADFRRKEADYDKETNHGVKQGAWFGR